MSMFLFFKPMQISIAVSSDRLGIPEIEPAPFQNSISVGVDLFSLSKVTVGERALAKGWPGKPLISLVFLSSFFERIVSTPTNGDTKFKAGKRPTLSLIHISEPT